MKRALGCLVIVAIILTVDARAGVRPQPLSDPRSGYATRGAHGGTAQNATAGTAPARAVDPASSVDPKKGGKSIFAGGIVRHYVEGSGEDDFDESSDSGFEEPVGETVEPVLDQPAPDPTVDPGKTVRFFIAKGLGWPAIKEAFGPDPQRMTALVEFRRQVVNALLDTLCTVDQKGEVGYESNGSVNLTSDYDLSVFDKGKGLGSPADVVKGFNERFRAQWGCESGTAFDTNIYDKGDALPTRGVAPHPDVVKAQEAIGAENGQVQDVAALVKVRCYMPNDEEGDPRFSAAWDAYCRKSQEAISSDPSHPTRKRLAENQREANQQFIDSEVALAEKIEQLRAQGSAQSEEDLELHASNALYGEALDKVQAARREEAGQLRALQNARKIQDPTARESAIRIAEEALEAAELKIKKTMSVSLNFANEAYNSEGALVDVVGNQQGAVKAAVGTANPAFPDGKKPLTPQDILSSFNEQYGDALKDLRHYGSDPVVCGIQTSKYVDRFIKAGLEICKTGSDNPIAKQAAGELQAMVQPNSSLKAMRGDKDLPRDKAPSLIAQVGGAVSADAYADKLTRLNITMNAIMRGGSTGATAAGRRVVNLQTSNGKFVVAEQGGGGVVNANRGVAGPWEAFTLTDLNGGELVDGDKVALQAMNGQYVCAEQGGGGIVNANRAALGPWETFTFKRLAGGKVALQSVNGQYVCAEGGGGRELVANRSTLGPWETFTIVELKK
jgi:hypothetical protein